MWIKTYEGELVNLAHVKSVGLTELPGDQGRVDARLDEVGTKVKVLFMGPEQEARSYLDNLQEQLHGARALLVVSAEPHAEPKPYGGPAPRPGVKTIIAPVAGEGPPLKFELLEGPSPDDFRH